MASSSKISLTQPRQLGEYSQAPVPEKEGLKPQQDGRRTVARWEIDLVKECNNCGKHIKKMKRSLVCGCKQVLYCSFDCQQSSSHKASCQGKENRDTTKQDLLECYAKCEADREANPGPTWDRMEELMKRSVNRQENIQEMAEAGDPMAAYVIGSAYAERRMCHIKGCEDSEKCPARGSTMPQKYLKKSVLETNEIAIKWLKVAAEGGIPEAMFFLAKKLQEDGGLVTDKRVAHYWLTKAYETGELDLVSEILENGAWGGLLVGEFVSLHDSTANIEEKCGMTMQGPTLSHLLMATRWQQLRDCGGKTSMGKPFFGQYYFNKFMENVGKLEKLSEEQPSIAVENKRNILFVFCSGRAGSIDAVTRSVVVKERWESNTKFMQGVSAEVTPDFQLLIQTATNGVFTRMEGRSTYLVSCKHHEIKIEGASHVEGPAGSNLGKKGMSMAMEGKMDWTQLKNSKGAGECQNCHNDAVQRLHAVSQGLYSISITEAIPNYGYAARYVNKTGVIVEDVFKSYSRPDMAQVLQILMSNPADLHPLAVAEDQNLYWPIIWYWGSVFYAIQDTCDEITLEAVYGRLGDKITILRSAPTSALAAFPETAAGEWRIACGSEECPRLDHEVKFQMCQGCKVRRYCNEVCQRKDWTKHKKFCKAGRKDRV